VKKDGNGEITHSFVYLKETDETEEVWDCLRHWNRQLERVKVEQLETQVQNSVPLEGGFVRLN